MGTPLDLLAATDFAALEHAYGSAHDLPERLAGLLSGEPRSVAEALGVLDSAVLHQGGIYSCTAPAALFVAGILGDERTGVACVSPLPWDDRVRPVRAALLEWLGAVGESAALGGEDPAERQCRAITPALYRAVAPFIDDPAAPVRAAALIAAEPLLTDPGLADARTSLAERLTVDAPRRHPRERAQVALLLDRWGIAPRALLTDPDPAVRAYAAVARSLDDDPAALAEVRTAVRDPGGVNGWFEGDEPQRSGWFLETLTAALLRRTTSFEEVETEALAIAGADGTYPRQAAIRTLLPRAFPPGRSPSPAALRFRAALTPPGGRESAQRPGG